MVSIPTCQFGHHGAANERGDGSVFGSCDSRETLRNFVRQLERNKNWESRRTHASTLRSEVFTDNPV